MCKIVLLKQKKKSSESAEVGVNQRGVRWNNFLVYSKYFPKNSTTESDLKIFTNVVGIGVLL